MTRYVVAQRRSGDDYLDDRALPPLGHPQVFVGDPVATGLLDDSGNPIYRLPDQIGFLPSSSDEDRPAVATLAALSVPVQLSFDF